VKYLVVLEKTENNWAAYSPDVPGCMATGGSEVEALQEYAAALRFHLDGLLEDGVPLPEPKTRAEYVALS